MVRKSIPVSPPAAATGGSAAAAQPARVTKASRSKPRARSRQSTSGVSRDDIARLAYALWEQRGGRGGSPEQDWFLAESQLRTKTSSAS